MEGVISMKPVGATNKIQLYGRPRQKVSDQCAAVIWKKIERSLP